MNEPLVPPHLRVWQLGLGFANTSVLHALIKAGLIEQLRHQPKTLRELAESCQLIPDVLHRVLRFSTVIDVTAQNGDLYSLTEMGRLLLKDVPGSLHAGILLAGSEPWQRAWQNLFHSLTTGKIAFDHAHGDAFFDYLDKHPEYGTPYHQWMTLSTTMTARAIAEAYDFSTFRTVCDIGGGQGVLLKNILNASPHLNGILYDQESVVKDHVLTDLPERVEVIAGDFFKSIPKADVLMLKSVLHDWSDENCRIILGHCRKAMQPSSRLLIMDMVIGNPADLMGVFYDLHMQVLLGGRERTENEFSALLQSVGMKMNRIIPTRSPIKIVEASLSMPD